MQVKTSMYCPRQFCWNHGGSFFFSLILPAKEQLENAGKLNLLIVPIGFICGVGLLMLIDKLLPHEHMMSHVQEGINPSHYSKISY